MCSKIDQNSLKTKQLKCLKQMNSVNYCQLPFEVLNHHKEKLISQIQNTISWPAKFLDPYPIE